MLPPEEGLLQAADRRWFARETLVLFGLAAAVFLASLLVVERDLPALIRAVSAAKSGGSSNPGLSGWTWLRVVSTLALWLIGVYAGAVQAARWGTALRALRRKYRGRPPGRT